MLRSKQRRNDCRNCSDGGLAPDSQSQESGGQRGNHGVAARLRAVWTAKELVRLAASSIGFAAAVLTLVAALINNPEAAANLISLLRLVP
jgi:hypothetical protein